jgi:hypothetical protein
MTLTPARLSPGAALGVWVWKAPVPSVVRVVDAPLSAWAMVATPMVVKRALAVGTPADDPTDVKVVV